MPQPPPQGGAAEAPASERVLLARTAIAAALMVDGVVEAHAPEKGGVVTGSSGGAAIQGVRVLAGEGGRYDVDLHLVARLVPLPPLAERVRSRVTKAAQRAGLADRLGPVSIRFEDLAVAEDLAMAHEGGGRP